MRRFTRLGLFLLLLSTGWPCLAEDRPDFSGSWQLNEELSDDVQEKMQQMRSSAGRGGRAGRGGFGGGRGGFGAGGRGQGGGNRGGQAGGASGRLAALQQGAERLDITHQEASFAVVDAADRQRSVSIDGDPTVVTTPSGDEVEMSAEWKRGDRLEMTIQRPERPEITELYELVAEGERLYVTVKIKGSGRRPSFEFRRVYDRSPANEAEAAEPAAQESGLSAGS